MGFDKNLLYEGLKHELFSKNLRRTQI